MGISCNPNMPKFGPWSTRKLGFKRWNLEVFHGFPAVIFPRFSSVHVQPQCKDLFFGSYIHFKVFPKENRCFGAEKLYQCLPQQDEPGQAMPQHKSTFRDPYRKTEKMNVNCLTSNPSCHMRQMWIFAFSCCFMSWNQGIRLDQRLGYTDQPMISEVVCRPPCR